MNNKKTVVSIKLIFLLTFLPLSFGLNAQSIHASKNSIYVASISSELLLEAGSVLLVETVKPLAIGTGYLIELSINGTKTSIKIAETALTKSMHLSQDMITISAISSGWLLIAMGNVIAFIPNSLGKQLLFHFQHKTISE